VLVFRARPHDRDERVGQTDEDRMRRAIEVAGGARRRVSPNPWVGAVVVPGDEPDHPGFEGATQPPGGAHAEAVALHAAGGRAHGATVYTTLEPCSHHGRTPPCADALVDAGVARVVIGTTDPDPKVAGQGIDRLLAASIDVKVGVCEEEVVDQLRPYLTHRRTGRPFVVLKLAATLDGRIAAPDGTSRWITGDAARVDAHRLRADSDAILVGAGTVRADDPALTVRLPDGEADDVEPLRVVLGQVPADAAVQPAMQVSGELVSVLELLGAGGVLQLLVEGGATVAHDLHAAGLVDRYVVYFAPALFGGDDARPMFAGVGASTIDELMRGRIVGVRRLGDDVRIDLEPEPRSGKDA
jgi:diaminohydroxyphosphoribosylaminopyrimidine deaminase/5-amino-6-(5-phosphoribosylamino)uracil reductase